MNAFPFRIVGFDLDGTLLDTSRELTASVNHTLATLGLPPLTVEEVTPMVGRGAANMLRAGLAKRGDVSEDDFRTHLPVMLEHYRDNLGRDSNGYPGLAAAMDGLDANGVIMAVVTNKYERFAVTLLERLELLGRFACVIGGDTMGPGKAKPHAAPVEEMIARCGGGRAAFVGDSIYDVGAAHAAGIPCVAVSFGFVHGAVEELGADAVIDHFDELMPTLTALAGRPSAI